MLTTVDWEALITVVSDQNSGPNVITA